MSSSPYSSCIVVDSTSSTDCGSKVVIFSVVLEIITSGTDGASGTTETSAEKKIRIKSTILDPK